MEPLLVERHEVGNSLEAIILDDRPTGQKNEPMKPSGPGAFSLGALVITE
jgi:hypothetical protein